MPTTRTVVCTSCGATNMGVHESCMICGTLLPDAQQAPAAAYTMTPQPASTGSPSTPEAAQPPAAAAERLCTRCGARLPEQGRFCVECGTPADAAALSPTAAAVCANCHAELPPGGRFCVNCGTPVAG